MIQLIDYTGMGMTYPDLHALNLIMIASGKFDPEIVKNTSFGDKISRLSSIDKSDLVIFDCINYTFYDDETKETTPSNLLGLIDKNEYLYSLDKMRELALSVHPFINFLLEN